MGLNPTMGRFLIARLRTRLTATMIGCSPMSSWKVRAPNQPRHLRPMPIRDAGSSGRAAAGGVRIANVAGAAFTNRRVIEPVEARITVAVGMLLVFLAALFGFFPRVRAYPLVLLLISHSGIFIVVPRGMLAHVRHRVTCAPGSSAPQTERDHALRGWTMRPPRQCSTPVH